jgi:hypothetical protein
MLNIEYRILHNVVTHIYLFLRLRLRLALLLRAICRLNATLFAAVFAPFTPKLNPNAMELYTAATPLVTTGIDVFTAPLVIIPTFFNPLSTTGRARSVVLRRERMTDFRCFLVLCEFAIIEYTYKIFTGDKIFAYVILKWI